MANGISINIGVNECSADHYGGWTGPLKDPENDAKAIYNIAQDMGYETRLLLTAEATRANVVNAIKDAAQRLDTDDALIVSFAGHGGQVPDTSGDEEDQTDETWCLYDSQLIDDELGELWALFKPGVRILLVCDCCHSGTVSRDVDDDLLAKEAAEVGNAKPRMMPDEAAFATFRGNSNFYTKVMSEIPATPTPIEATVQLISGCQDDQKSYDGDEGENNGKFTSALLKVWADGEFDGDYVRFHADIIKSMPWWQQPNHLTIGAKNEAFHKQKPFEI